MNNAQMTAKLPPGTTQKLSERPELLIRRDAIPLLMRLLGCKSVIHPDPEMARTGVLAMECPLCGVRLAGMTCEQDKHDAYYEALEKGEREPIEWKGDERERG